MKIENQKLVVTVGEEEKRYPLLEVGADAVVRAWAVPEDYRPGGLFVAVTELGQAEEYPACAPADAVYLGAVELPAGDAARLARAKAAKLAELNDACDKAVAALASTYPEREIQSWLQQVKEAEALDADPEASAPLLSAIATARALPVAELASRVLAKMVAYAHASGALIGIRQAAEDMLELAETEEDVAAIQFRVEQ